VPKQRESYGLNEEWILSCLKCKKSYKTSAEAYRTMDKILVTPGKRQDMDNTDPITAMFPRIHIKPKSNYCAACGGNQ